MIREYLNFVLLADQVKLDESGLKKFTVQVLDSPAGQGNPQTVTVNADITRLSDELEVGAPKAERLMTIGESLANLLFLDDSQVRGLYVRSLERLQYDQGLRLRLQLDHKLADLPWEYMHIQRGGGEKNITGFLAIDPRLSIVRHERMPFSGDLITTPKQRRILIALANSDASQPLALTKEKHNLDQALQNLEGFEYDFIETTTSQSLSDKLLRGADIFHFAGHGSFDDISGGALALTTESGTLVTMPADTFAAYFLGRGVQLVVLAACQTGSRHGRNVWNGVVASLMQVGIPAAVAMQYKICDDSAVIFSRSFYKALAEGMLIDEAMHAGRFAIFSQFDSLRDDEDFGKCWRDWGVPVLYLRSKQELRLPALRTLQTKSSRSPGSKPSRPPLNVTKSLGEVFELPQNVAATIESFTGRAWLLPHLIKWLEQTNDRIFVLKGGPGTGKSTIMAWLAGRGPSPSPPEAKKQLEKVRASVKAAYFCNAASLNILPTTFAANLFAQLRHNLPDLNELFSTIHDDQITVNQFIENVDPNSRTNGVTEESSFDLYLLKPLQKLYKNEYNQPIIILVDALDETLAYSHSGTSKILQLFARLSDLPSQVRFIVTTRPDQRVLKYFRQSFDLIKDASVNVDDVRLYAYERLHELEIEKRAKLADRIAREARGMFLYAQQVIDDLQVHMNNVTNIDQLPLPKGLIGFYHQFLTREIGNNEDYWYESFKPLLGLIAVARDEGLNRTQLEKLIGTEIERELRVCKQYLNGEPPEGPFRVFHKSFSDFLLEDENNRDYHIDAKAMHRKIFSYYWGNHSKSWEKCDAYGLNYLAAHLFECRGTEEIQKLKTLIGEEWMRARFKRNGYSYSGFLSDLELAWQAALSEDQIDHLAFIRMQMARQVVNRQASIFTDTDLQTLVWLHREEEALAYARLRHLPWEKFDGVLTIYNTLEERNIIENAGRNHEALLKEAENLAYSIEDNYWKAPVLCNLAIALYQAGRQSEAERLARSIAEVERREKAFQAMTRPSQTPEDNVDLETWLEYTNLLARQISKEEDRERAEELRRDLAEQLRELAIAMKKNGDNRATSIFKKTFEAGNALENLVHRTEVIRELALAMSQCKEGEANKIFDHALAVAYSIEGYKYRTEALNAIAVVLLASEKKKEAEEVLDTIQYDKQRVLTSPKLALAYAKAGDSKTALTLCNAIQDPHRRAVTLGRVALTLTNTDKSQASSVFDQALESAHTLSEQQGKANALRELACVAALFKNERALKIFEEAIAAVDSVTAIPEADVQVFELCEIALALYSLDEGYAKVILDRAINFAGSIKEEVNWAIALCKLASTMTQLSDTRAETMLEKARIRVRILHEESGKTLPLRYLAEALMQAGKFDEADEVIQSIQDYKMRGYRKLAEALAKDGNLPKALEKLGTRRIDEFILILCDWAQYFEQMNAGMSLEVLRQATEVAGWVRPDWQRINKLLCSVA